MWLVNSFGPHCMASLVLMPGRLLVARLFPQHTCMAVS